MCIRDRPNEKWCGDITYVKTWKGWGYDATVIDLYSRKVIGYAVADPVSYTHLDVYKRQPVMSLPSRRL